MYIICKLKKFVFSEAKFTWYLQPQHFADDSCFEAFEVVRAYCSPLTIVVYFHPPSVTCGASGQTELWKSKKLMK